MLALSPTRSHEERELTDEALRGALTKLVWPFYGLTHMVRLSLCLRAKRYMTGQGHERNEQHGRVGIVAWLDITGHGSAK